MPIPSWDSGIFSTPFYTLDLDSYSKSFPMYFPSVCYWVGLGINRLIRPITLFDFILIETNTPCQTLVISPFGRLYLGNL
jgi:hypothetical protein